ncbi:MAG: dienelactone hydrolase family protein [Candidatus Eremiobacteraeota bacterium]|nr:dienelactone hydrolase family protein [Candidatus Eremiobacteraeota bacterium]
MDEIDPTQSTSPELNRRTFVGLSAAAAAAAGSIARAIAAGEVMGKPHAPIVAEDDPSIAVERVQLSRPGGAIGAYAAYPKKAGPLTSGLVVVMHIWGVDTSIRDVVRRYAKEGYVAVAPDLYSRFGAPTGDGVSDIAVFRPFASRLQESQVAGDLNAAAQWIEAAHPHAKVGVTGFCMGGKLCLQQAILNPAVFSANAPFYGDPRGIDPAKVHVPVCGSYGARDTSIPAESVLAFKSALKVPNDIKIYPEAGHAFFDDQRASFVPSAAADAWHRTLAFFAKYLRGEVE